MWMEIEILGEDGELRVPITLLYVVLREGCGRLVGRKLVVTDVEKLVGLQSVSETIPEVEFCPSGEPQPLYDVDEVLAQVCTEVYRYFPGDEGSRCAACAVKVYSILGDMWLVNEDQLVKLLEIAKRYGLPIEWSKGNIVYTTCPPDYRDALSWEPGSYVKGLEKLRIAAKDIAEVLGYEYRA